MSGTTTDKTRCEKRGIDFRLVSELGPAHCAKCALSTTTATVSCDQTQTDVVRQFLQLQRIHQIGCPWLLEPSSISAMYSIAVLRVSPGAKVLLCPTPFSAYVRKFLSALSPDSSAHVSVDCCVTTPTTRLVRPADCMILVTCLHVNVASAPYADNPGFANWTCINTCLHANLIQQYH